MLHAAVQEKIRRFVVGLVSVDDLSDWLDAHAQDILNTGSSEARRLLDLTFSLLEDEIQGHRGEDEVRTILASQVPPTVTLMHSSECTNGTATVASWSAVVITGRV